MEELLKAWQEITETYYKASNPTQYQSQLRKLKRIEELKSKILSCSAALDALMLIGDEDVRKKEAESILSDLGVRKFDKNAIRSKILRDKTNLELLIKSQRTEEKKQEVNFWRLVASAEKALGRQIDIENVTVARWIAYIDQIKEQQDGRKN